MTYQSKNFQVDIKQQRNKFLLTQLVLHPAVYTDDLPATVDILENYLPSIFTNKCFNYRKQSFREEVKSTQVGHLFEHIILENLKILAEAEYEVATFKGETSWNWFKEKSGQFNIVVHSDRLKRPHFIKAFKNATDLLEKIYVESQESDKH